MTNGSDRLDRIERILEEVAKTQQEMAARQRYHDEAFERFDADMKQIKEASAENTANIAENTANIKALVRLAGQHHRRLDSLESAQ